MKITIWLLLFLSLSLSINAQKAKDRPLFAKQNLVAWCIVPFDKMKRNPAERAEMLKELGISQLAWDWRDVHLSTMEEEIRTLRKNNIRLKSVWFWVNGGSGETLDETNHFILKTLKENNVKTELWLSFNDRYFAGISDSEKLKKAINAIGEINGKAKEIGCTLHLYNHGSWFGEPENQVKIIEGVGEKGIGIVYNFHHARHQVNDFPKLLKIMLPYLSTVNINGMKENGPMILTVGQGDKELWMLQRLKESGYKGSIGILSHVDDEDAKVVLQRNLEGLKTLLKKMREDKALATY
jgi:sugar phosphate isomerase/epimerase